MVTLSREAPIDPAHTASLIIDLQNYRIGNEARMTENFCQSLRDKVLPNIRCQQLACRQTGIEQRLHLDQYRLSVERHHLVGVRGYYRQRTTDALVAEIAAVRGAVTF